ncbi:ABC transporter ATP-binding protein [Eisenbergiella sp.]
MNHNAKYQRKMLIRQFFLHNHTTALLGMLAVVLNTVLNLAIAWQMQQLIDIAAGSGAVLTIAQMCVVFFLSFVLMGVIMAINVYARPLFLKRALQQYRDYAFAILTGKSAFAFGRENTSAYLSALTNDTLSIETNYLSALFTLPANVLMLAGVLGLMLYYSPLLTAAALTASLLPLGASLLAGGRLPEQEKRVSDAAEAFLAALKDMLSGFPVVKSFQAEKEALRLFSGSNTSLQQVKCHAARTRTALQYIGGAAGNLTIFTVFLLGAALALSGRGVTAGVVMVFAQLMESFASSLSVIPQIWANRKAADALIDKLASALESHTSSNGVPAPSVLKDGITVQGLSFAYNDETPALQDISFHFAAGGKYAVAGGSGSGKSTLLGLLQGSHDGYRGRILFDGKELRTLRQDSLYDLISVIQQDVFIFNSSVQDNITMFRGFPSSEVDRVIRLAGLKGLIDTRGADCPCGENGNALSGGERQRISIARSLLQETPVLLVDEATASLDPVTALGVTDAILSLDGLTRILVTHRLEEAMLRRCDGILALKNGRLEECGTFDELMERKGYFYSLFMVS